MNRLCCLFLLLLPVSAMAQPAVPLDSAAFDRLTGFYRLPDALRPNTVVMVSREGGHFFVQLTRQPAREILAESPTSFFMQGLPVKITFELGPDGKATGLVIHQGGRDGQAPRIDEAAAKAIEALPPPKPKGHPMARTWSIMPAIVPRTLTGGDGVSLDYWPCFSPDGKTILFSRTRDGGKSWTLMRMAASGGEAVPFFSQPLAVSATRADWGRGGQVAFTGTGPDGSSGLWIADGDGRNAHVVAVSGRSSQLFYPSWYPDGKSLAVLDADTLTVVRVDVSGGAATVLTDRAQVMTGMPSVSPDGVAVVFAGQKNAGQPYNQEENVVWLRTDDGTVPLEHPPLQGRAPVWSPDGKRIAFESDRGSPEAQYAIFIINRDGTGLVQVTDYALNATHPVWSRDGKHMVFAAGDPAKKISTIDVIDLP
jgi:dipeptidyl aminopeptidase/acylaminoacyl peptidase